MSKSIIDKNFFSVFSIMVDFWKTVHNACNVKNATQIADTFYWKTFTKGMFSIFSKYKNVSKY